MLCEYSASARLEWSYMLEGGYRDWNAGVLKEGRTAAACEVEKHASCRLRAIDDGCADLVGWHSNGHTHTIVCPSTTTFGWQQKCLI